MRKFITLFALCGLISGQAHAKVFHIASKSYGCAQKAGTSLYKNSPYQILGKTNGGEYYNTNANITCLPSGGINATGTNWCNTTVFRSNDVINAKYCLRTNPNKEDNTHCVNQDKLAGGNEGYVINKACVYASCQKGYIKASDTKCLKVEDIAKCKESNIKYTSSVKGEWKQTGQNVGAYCFKESNITELATDNQTNICLAGKHAVRDMNDPTGYFFCDANGKWKKENYSHCVGITDECTSGSDGCVAQLLDNSTKEVKTNTNGTGQTWIRDTGSTVCVKWVCDQATHVKSDNKCITKEQNQKNIANKKKAVQTAKEKQNMCENSGGKWSKNKCTCSAPNTTLDTDECACKPEHIWNNNSDKSQGCKPTDKEAYKKACNAATAGTTTWNDAISTCVCTNTDQTFDMTTGACKDNADFAACQPLVLRGIASWNSGAKQCVCNQAGYIVQDNDCIESDATRQERERQEQEEANRVKQEKLSISRPKISEAHNNLKTIQASLKTSVWKDEEGKFNTTRLTYDAAAGVVLGTIGGVVTSNTIQKKQVENGFEDIKCSINGHIVADWGDEFSVSFQ